MIDINDSIGPVANYSYDENGNILTNTDGLGNTSRYTYDDADRRTESYDPLVETPTDKYTRYEYDKNSKVTRIIGNEGLVADYEYDPLNRLTSITRDPNGLDIAITRQYDGLSNKIQAADDNNNTCTYEYDSVNRLARTQYADGTEKRFTYNGAGRLTEVNDQMGNTTTYEYDDLNRRIKAAYADGNEDTVTYDRAGHILSATNRCSRVETTYDSAGRLTSSTQTDLPQTYSYTVSYAYTIEPNATCTITYPDGSQVKEVYDDSDRLSEVWQDDVKTVWYTYQNPSNRVLSKHFANGTRADLDWDEDNRITELAHKATDGTTVFAGFDYDYDALGNQLSAKNLQQVLVYDDDKPVTQSVSYDYDAASRLTEFKRGPMEPNGVIPAPTRRRTWTIDGTNNWNEFSIQDTIDGNENGTYENSVNQMNGYDTFMADVNALLGDIDDSNSVDFNDLAVIASNWLETCAGPTWCDGADIDHSSSVNFADYVVFADHWLQNAKEPYNLSYDKNGNLIDDSIMEYYWDYDHGSLNKTAGRDSGAGSSGSSALRSKNQLTQVKRKSDGRILGQYKYDAFDRRIAKTVDSNTTNYVYDGWRVIAEYQNGVPERSYAYGRGIDEILTMDNSADKQYFFHSNVLGSIDAVTDEDGNVVERYSYDAFGKPVFSDANGNKTVQSAIDNPYLFTGREYDVDTGLYNYRTRYQNPDLGRFINPDKVGIWYDAGNLGNGFSYVGNNPGSQVDSTGQTTEFPMPQFHYFDFTALENYNNIGSGYTLRGGNTFGNIITFGDNIVISGWPPLDLPWPGDNDNPEIGSAPKMPTIGIRRPEAPKAADIGMPGMSHTCGDPCSDPCDNFMVHRDFKNIKTGEKTGETLKNDNATNDKSGLIGKEGFKEKLGGQYQGEGTADSDYEELYELYTDDQGNKHYRRSCVLTEYNDNGTKMVYDVFYEIITEGTKSGGGGF